jgi:transposase
VKILGWETNGFWLLLKRLEAERFVWPRADAAVPRMRNLAERFESRVLPLFKRRTAELGAMLPQLYLHGLSSGDFELALRGALGRGRAAFRSVAVAAQGRLASGVRKLEAC